MSAIEILLLGVGGIVLVGGYQWGSVTLGCIGAGLVGLGSMPTLGELWSALRGQ